ncbi:hypothetical protein BRC97_08860 [Halobacteriales archaeon QS_6_71_20]|nr:MAG: hypothetical protein BRC97_08860 [Halobacteriales archaeon QS_6_71_20]
MPGHKGPLVRIGALLTITGGIAPWITVAPQSWLGGYFFGMRSGLELYGEFLVVGGVIVLTASVLSDLGSRLAVIAAGYGVASIAVAVGEFVRINAVDGILPGIGVYLCALGGVVLLAGGFGERIVSLVSNVVSGIRPPSRS